MKKGYETNYIDRIYLGPPKRKKKVVYFSVEYTRRVWPQVSQCIVCGSLIVRVDVVMKRIVVGCD